MRYDGSISFTVIVDRNAAAADASYRGADGTLMEASGSAKRSPGEIFSAEVGANVAVGRALAALGEKFTNVGLNEVAG